MKNSKDYRLINTMTIRMNHPAKISMMKARVQEKPDVAVVNENIFCEHKLIKMMYFLH